METSNSPTELAEELIASYAAPPKQSRSIKTCVGCSVPLCSVCNVCHSPSCQFTELAVYNAVTAAKYRHLQAKTQKARGFVSLEKKAGLRVPTPYFLILEKADIEPAVDAALNQGMYTIFVRPCPVRARHGFEESRSVVYDATKGPKDPTERARVINQIHKIFSAANEADEEHAAELILLPFVNAKYNAIITPSQMAVGPNHDGATAGYDSISIPLMGADFYENTISNLLGAAGISPTEDPYVEVVLDSYLTHPRFTQIRAGVKVPAAVGADYLPAPMRVVKVIDAEGDLLEWEKQVKTIEPGTVVVKLGGTLISHYGVHCLYNKVPCFTSRRPEIGELLDVVSVSPTPDPEAVIKGLAYGALVSINLKGDGNLSTIDRESAQTVPVDCALIAMMTILHNAGAMSGDHGFWLGYAASFMLRAGMAGSHGEARHKLQDLQNMRSYVYKLAFKDFMGSRNTLGTAQWMFQNLKWSSSFGGPAWAKCTQSVIDLDASIVKLLNDKSSDSVSLVVSKLNNAINQAHNGGWWLNKFINHSWFDMAAKQSLKSLAISGAIMYRIKKAPITAEDIDSLLSAWKASKTIEPTPGGKLHVQLHSEDIDQTVYTVSGVDKKPADVAMHSMELSSIYADYVGAMCMSCYTKFDFFKSADEISIGQLCGTKILGAACQGLVGWAADGELVYKTAPSSLSPDDVDDDEDSSDDYDSSDDDDSDGDSDTVESDVPFEVPPGTTVNYNVESWPPVKMKGASTKLQNINGMKAFTGAVSEAQCTFTYSKYHKVITLIHVQYKSSDAPSEFYFSAGSQSIQGTVTETQVAKILKGQTDPKVSWSGSNIANYWPLQQVDEGAVTVDDKTYQRFKLTQPELKLSLWLCPVTGGIEIVKEEVEK